MKKILLILLLQFSIFSFQSSFGQIVCIMCFDQNDSISTGINNLIANGGFENTTCIASTGVIGSPTSFCPNSTGYSCDLLDWTCTGGGTSTYACIYDVVTNKSMIEEGNNSVYMGNFYANPCSSTSGDTSCLVMTDCEASGIPAGYPLNPDPAFGSAVGVSIEQTVNGLIVGNTYILEFWAGGEEYMTDPGMFAVDLGFGNTFLRDNNTPVGTGIGTRFIIEWRPTSTSHTIKFTNWGHICSNCTELVLDDVRLYTLAELNPSVPPCPNTNPVAIFSAPNHICPGTCTNFNNLSINATSYLWSFTGATPTTSTDLNPTNICYNTPGSYDVQLIVSNATGGDTLLLHNFITVYPYPAPQGIAQSGDTLFANAGAVSYQWYQAGVLIPGATDYFYVATSSGNYNVVATDVNNCEVEAAIFDVVAGVQSLGNSHSSFVYPNPVGDKCTIHASPFTMGTAVTIKIYNVLGVAVQSEGTNQKSEMSVDVSALPSGIYIVQVTGNSGTFRSKFIKQ